MFIALLLAPIAAMPAVIGVPLPAVSRGGTAPITTIGLPSTPAAPVASLRRSMTAIERVQHTAIRYDRRLSDTEETAVLPATTARLPRLDTGRRRGSPIEGGLELRMSGDLAGVAPSFGLSGGMGRAVERMLRR